MKEFEAAEAVLFDMDGVITDSMPKHCRCWQKAFRDFFGISVPSLEIYRREGEKSDKSVREILALSGRSISDHELHEFLDHKASLFSGTGKIRFFKGMKTFLKKLHRIKKTALVTGTQRREVLAHFDEKFLSVFDTLVTSTDVTHGKPHPEPYQKALTRLGVSPEKTLVVENAPYGIQSAKACGLKVIALPTSLPASELKAADFVLKSHEELFALL